MLSSIAIVGQAFQIQFLHAQITHPTQQMETLPKDDIQIAIRDGRVVKGMTAQQVVQTLAISSSRPTTFAEQSWFTTALIY